MWKIFLQKILPLFILGGAFFIGVRTVEKHLAYKEKAAALEETIDNLNQEISQAKIRLDDSIAVYMAKVKTLQVTNSNLENKYGRLLKSSKTRSKDIESITEVGAVIQSVDTVIAYVDTFGGIKAGYNDEFLKVSVEIFPDRNTIIDYRLRDSLTILNVQKKHSWLFGLIKWKEHKETKVINHNPKASITGLSSVEIIE